MKDKKITLDFEGGTQKASQLISEMFLGAYGNTVLNRLEDSAELIVPEKKIAFTTDSYTVKPLFFPGGDIGKLSVCGTINDLCVKGARPQALSVSFIIEEGFLWDDLARIVSSIAVTSNEAQVPIVTGDTKIVNKGEVDGIFINTSGIGCIEKGFNISSARAKPGDDIIITGSIAEHGMCIFNERQKLGFKPDIVSDVMLLLPLLDKILEFAEYIHAMRDPTRGGVAASLNEIALASRVTISIFEEKIPILEPVAACCNLLGIDPLYVANEGKMLIFVDSHKSQDVLKKIQTSPFGQKAAIIGKVNKVPFSELSPLVDVVTAIGTKRFLPLADNILLPRIC